MTFFPNLRFPGFDKEWEEKKLGEIMKNISSGKSKSITSQGKYPFFGSTGIISYSNKSDYSGDKILIARVGANAGFIYKVEGSYAVSDNALILDVKNEKSLDFIFYYLLKYNLNKLIFGSGQPLITGGQLKSIEIKLPLIEEQKKISSFIFLIDKRIQTQKKIIEKLETLMKGLRERLFSQKLRFKDENDKVNSTWKIKELRQISKIFGGGTPDTNKSEYWNGNIQWFTPTEIKSNFVSKSERTITKEGLRNSSAKSLPKGTILITTRATIGEVAIALEECTTNQGFQSLVVEEGVNNIYLFNWIIQNKIELMKRSNGSTFPEISKSEIEKIKVSFPNLYEQTKIANFLSFIQEKIETEKQILEKLELQKKFLLSNLFV
ncbi:hypothetical protein CMU96_10260 [Elizabethkingia anophelis]|nr:hypothetical protein [Elizabethkingia anophelis]MDV2465816.1 hypothetical protein [Elizabethkingia anophelis]MDV3824153.1 hypothetical protein [Elizabethkingia anophelis]MDV3851726.1 hypothetical protein [Elizabethkingia anophelis]